MLRGHLKIISILIGFLFFSTPVFAQINAKQTKDIDTTIQSMLHAYESRDLNTLKNLYAENAVIIGTGNDEIIQGRENIIAGFKRDFSQSLKAHIKAEKIAVDAKKGVAFATYKVIFKVDIPHSAPFQSTLRFSVAMIKENRHWVILQSHLSAPMIDQKPGKSFPMA